MLFIVVYMVLKWIQINHCLSVSIREKSISKILLREENSILVFGCSSDGTEMQDLYARRYWELTRCYMYLDNRYVNLWVIINVVYSEEWFDSITNYL